MAGEWLKFESTLPEKAETLAITAAMGWDDPDLTVGKLMRMFRWFDQQTIDGNAPNVTPALLDRIIGVTGFVSAVASVGWIVIDGTSLSLHNFDRHNGETAKSRALTAKRVAKHKANASGNAAGNADSVSSALPKEEKKREEKKEDKKQPAAAFVLPDWVPAEPWAGYVEMRSKKKNGAMTNRARDLKIAELLKFKDAGHDIGAILDKSTANGWTDIYEPKGSPSGKSESFV